MKAISIRQPFAGFVATGEKHLEIRSKQTNYRGWIVICSGKQLHEGNYLQPLKGNKFEVKNCQEGYENITKFYIPPSFKTGHAIAMANLVGCRPMEKNYHDTFHARHEYIEGHYVWEFDEVIPIDPFSVKGQLGLFEVEVTDRMLANI